MYINFLIWHKKTCCLDSYSFYSFQYCGNKMRFAAASTVLASTLPGIVRPLGVVQAHVDHEDLLQSNLYKRVSERKILSKKTATSQRRHAGRGRLLKTLMSDGGYGSNECNPDVGLLACGFGQFCDGSLDSALGGTCVSLPRFERRLQTDFGQANASVAPSDPTDSEISSPITSSPVTGNTSQTISPTLGNATDVSPASGPWVYCDPSSPFYGNLECECQEWSIENQTGSIICKLKPETCDEECENTCYSIDFHYISNGSDFSYRYCYQFVQPIEQQFCFGYSNDRTCLLSLDDTICSSCYTSYRLNCNYGSCYSQACSNFDCENAALGQGNSCYDPVVPPAFYDCYRELNDLYPSCALCSSDDIDYPEEYLDLPGYGSFNCSYIDSLARIGLLNPQQCTYATVLSATTCCQRDDVPVFKCNLCGQESHVITNG